MVRMRYSRWDGTQDIGFTQDDLMDHVAQEMLETGDLRGVLKRLMQRGADFASGRRMEGLQDLLERLRKRREENLDRYNLGGMMDDIKERLDRVVDTERSALNDILGDQPSEGSDSAPPESERSGDPAPSQGRQGDAGSGGEFEEMRRRIAQRRLERMNELPTDVGGRIRDLREYDFMDPAARQEFEDLLQLLQQQLMQSYFQGMQQSLQSMTPEALREIQQMVQDLNRMIQQRLRGERPDFDGFMQKWGHFFPPGIEDLDQLLEYLERQIAQMDALMKSMTPEMRQELEGMMQSLLQDTRLQWDLAQLAANLERLDPGSTSGDDFNFSGDEPVTLQEAMRLMGDMNSMESLEQELIDAARSNDASQIDSSEIERLLGQEAGEMAEQLQQITKMLEESGIIQRKGKNWELTPQAMRRIGQKALQDIFSKLRKGVSGSHDLPQTGPGVDAGEQFKRWEFGDPFTLDVQKTITNAVMRQGPGTPVKVTPEDFEISQTTAVTRCATVLMLDMSYSMLMGGYFQAGRRLALALDTLIRSQFPKDTLTVVAFSYFVLKLKPDMLLDSYWVEFGGGTNFQEAFRQARQILGRDKAETRQIIVITDGEPTTYSYWLDDDWDNPRGGMEQTLREVVRCTKDGITFNTFMMGRDPGAARFVGTVTKLNKGRAFLASADRLGQYVVTDYINSKRKVID